MRLSNSLLQLKFCNFGFGLAHVLVQPPRCLEHLHLGLSRSKPTYLKLSIIHSKRTCSTNPEIDLRTSKTKPLHLGWIFFLEALHILLDMIEHFLELVGLEDFVKDFLQRFRLVKRPQCVFLVTEDNVLEDGLLKHFFESVNL